MKKVALITGASTGIGESIAQRFLKEGMRVIVFDLDVPKYDGVEFYKVDVSKEDKIKNAFQNINELDILVNNAGIYFCASVEETTESQLDKIIGVNFKGPYLMCKYALPLLKKSKGNIVNIASCLGLVPEPESPAYCSTKAAVIMLTKAMAQEYAKDGVRVNAVLPGPIDTPLLREAVPVEAEFKEMEARIPFRRAGTPEEVANVVNFLVSDEASYVTGSLYAVDGGVSSSSIYSK